MKVVLGFDTSCYTTSASVVNERGEVICSSRMLLPVAQGQRGLRQSEAVFVHVRQMPQVMELVAEALAKSNAEVIGVCASSHPRDDQDSYMPVFMVGLGHAKVIAQTLNVPLMETSHQQGHIHAGQIGNQQMDKRFIALHISGGTTDLMLYDSGKITLLGSSLDLHAGQLVDRVGVAMGLSFPAGPALEQLAMRFAGETQAIFPVSMDDNDLSCHLSGAETRAMQLIEKQELSNEQIAAEIFDLLSRTIARLLAAACKRTNAKQVLIVGGVASSTLLRDWLNARMKKQCIGAQILFGQPCYSADNAAGVAAIGMKQLIAQSDYEGGK
ncbi:MAG: O-sialoglycoprotein endopeptidase [Clostridiales bacterium]|nr:O-sialoglycoprotein endopeptidase [Clostridiales bacterium]